ncbi:MAG: tRNA lysidine(34) synthetase TilS [Desulfovibrio sp.]|nr:tRNA lysidine(34) synthetase TilS [Desulfovibrio sp.]
MQPFPLALASLALALTLGLAGASAPVCAPAADAAGAGQAKADKAKPEKPKEHVDNSRFKFCYPVTGEGNYALPDGSVITCRVLNEFDREDIPEDTYTKWMDYAKMSDELCIRTRKSGDYLVINSKGNEGNLKNYMINEKIPKSERNDVPLLASGSKIYWVVGHRISEDVKVTDETKVVIEFSCKRPEEGV